MAAVVEYERTELIRTKTSLAFAKKRRDKAEQEVRELEQKIEDLQKETNQ